MTDIVEIHVDGELPRAPDNRQAAEVHVLIEATRLLMRKVATTDASPEALSAASSAIAEVMTLLGDEQHDHVLRIPFDNREIRRVHAGMPWTMFPFNPMGIPLNIEVEGSAARAELTPDALFEGPPGLLHGGFSAAMLDALLGTLVHAQGQPAYTGGLDFRFIRPTALHVPIVMEGRVLKTVGRKSYAEGWLSQGGERTVYVTGLFVQPVRRNDQENPTSVGGVT